MLNADPIERARAPRRARRGRLGVGEVHDVAGAQREIGVAEARGVDAGRRGPWITKICGSLSTVHVAIRSPSARTTASAYVGEPADHRAVGPAAGVLDPLREVPVVQGRVRRDAVREQLVDEAVVVVEAGRG